MSKGLQEFCEAIKQKDIEFVKTFSAQKKNLSPRMRNLDSPLHYAVKNSSNFEIIKILVEAGFEINTINSYKNTVLHLALQHNPTFEIISYLVKNNAKVRAINRYQDTPLLFACRYGSPIEVIQLLLDKGARVNYKNVNKYTPLHYAVMSKKNVNETSKIVSLLIKNGAKINLFNKKDTPLHQSLKTNTRLEIVKILIQNKANLKMKNNWGDTPLLHAANTDLPFPVLKFLLDSGSDPNVRDNDGFSTFTYSCQKPERSQLFYYLLNNGFKINVNAVDKKGFIPLFHAIKNNLQIEKIDLLLEKGALMNIGKKQAMGMTDNEEIKQLLLIHTTLTSDLRRILEKKIACDVELNEDISFHSQLFQIRTGKKLDKKTIEILKSYNNKVIKRLLNWIYFGLLSPKDKLCRELASKLKIANILKRRSKASIAQDLTKLYLDESTKDFTIIVNDKEIKMHKFVLIARSQLFRDMFTLVKNDSSNTVKDVSSKSFRSLKIMFKFFYSDVLEENEIDESILEELDDANDFYKLCRNSSLPYLIDKSWIKCLEN
ncbi:cyclin-dependent kinase inhibitor 2c [Anaeramoeba flamelloides]|uniref:Cyclin-dependent kinase inhibitor 2c n=1 Tax=Anaeramoeba flamelloides TaxID=1746091 RepID=A0AAV7Z2B7_9EUKA|nr:cyclin-dependent kinase inhibitor 2c [Anaeramoeba flamelloides]KAJ6244738.1 cyclin-dependent kinase inhibitor 2c [Anaeramoeba flamelloides]